MELKLIIGKKGIGKSILICDILKKEQKKEYLCIVSDGYQLGAETDTFKLYNKFNKCIGGDLEYLKKIYMNGTIRDIRGIIIDGYAHILKDEILKKIIKMDLDISIIVIVQYFEDLDQEILEKVDKVYCFNTSIGFIKKSLFDCFGKQFETFDSFTKTFDNYTNDYGCMIINTKLDTNYSYKVDINTLDL